MIKLYIKIISIYFFIKMKFINNDPLTMKKIAKRLALLLKLKRSKNNKYKEYKKNKSNI